MSRGGCVLIVADMGTPAGVDPVIAGFLHGKMRHKRRGAGAVPVPFVRVEPHGVAGADLLDIPAAALDQSGAHDHVQHLSIGVMMPRRAGRRREMHTKNARSRAGGSVTAISSIHTVPVQYSDGAWRLAGRFRVIFMPRSSRV